MPRSMTAYARGDSPSIDGALFSIEIHTVNRKHLDLHLHLPRELLFLDVELRKCVTEELVRGNVTVKIRLQSGEIAGPSLLLLKEIQTHLEKTAEALSFSAEEITLPFLFEQAEKGRVDEPPSTLLQQELKKILKQVLADLVKMKETEGEALAKDMSGRLSRLKNLVEEIEQLSRKMPEKIRAKMLQDLEELFKKAAEDERILKEVALYAERADVTEEITRLYSHLEQAQALLTSQDKSIGRTLEFLTQEMLREVNTIGSKSADLTITKKGIEMKAELEKIREQVHNIE